jgi:MraZ protein
MTIPTRHRDAFVEPDGLWVSLTRHPDGCVLMFPRSVWAEKRAELARLPQSARFIQRIFLGNASDVEADSAGRVLIPPELRDATGLVKDVMLMGMGSHFEIWDAPTLKRKENEAIQAGDPDAFANFTL